MHKVYAQDTMIEMGLFYKIKILNNVCEVVMRLSQSACGLLNWKHVNKRLFAIFPNMIIHYLI
jgi:hypothetical protein